MSSSTSSQSPVETLKLIAETYRHFFHAFVAAYDGGKVSKFEFMTGKRRLPEYLTDGQEVQVVVIHFDKGKAKDKSATDDEKDDEEDDKTTDCPIVPKGTDPDLKWAFSKWNMCDYSSVAFFEPLRLELADQVPGATIEWLRVNIIPKYIFRDADELPDYPDPWHSAFLVTLPKEGGKYVIDFTIEQFGFEESLWFLPENEYRKLAAGDIWKICDYEERYDALYEDLHRDLAECLVVLQSLCMKVDWDAVKMMDPERRRVRMMKMARKAVDPVAETLRGELPSEVPRAYA